MSDYKLTISGSLDVPKTIAEINAQIRKVQNSLSKLSLTDTKGIKQYTAEINNAGKLANALANAELNDTKRVGAAKNQSIQDEITARRKALSLAKLATAEAKFAAQQQKAAAQAIAAETKKVFAKDTLSTQISTAQIKIQAFAKQYSAIMSDPGLKNSWSKLVDESKLISSKEQLSLFNAKMGEFNQKVISAGKATRSFGDELKNNITKMSSWMLLGGLIASVVRQFKEVYTNVVAVNTAMVSLRKVTNETDATYSAFLDRTAQKAVELSASIAGLVEATANFARLGYSLNDAEMLGQVAVMYKNVGDGVESVDVATSTVISTMKAFGYTANDSMLIIDKLNEVGNNFAVSSSGIADALQRSSAAMANAGNSLDQTIGLIVAANNVIQDPDVVGKHMCPAA